jgi:hypothetical protein
VICTFQTHCRLCKYERYKMSFQTPSKTNQCNPAKPCNKLFTTTGKKAGVAFLFAAGCVLQQANAAAFISHSVSSSSFSRCRKHKLPSSIRKMQSTHEYFGEDEMTTPYFFSGEADDNDDNAVRRLDMQTTHDMIGPYIFSGEPRTGEVGVRRLEAIFQQASALVEKESVPIEASETIESANPGIPFHFSRDSSMFERIDRLRGIYDNDSQYVATAAMSDGLDSWQ